MSVDNLRNFFEPKGIVIVGARRSFGFGYGIPLFCRTMAGEIVSILSILREGSYTGGMFTNEFRMSPNLLIWPS